MIRIFTLLLLSLVLSHAQAQVGFQVSPGKIFFRQVSGQPGNQTVRVFNSSSVKMVLECTFMDWKRDSISQKVYSDPGSLPASLSRHLQANPATFSLEPGASQLVEVNMTLPEGLDRQVSNSMLFITQVNEKEIARPDKPKGASVVFRVQMGIHVYNEPPQLITKNVSIEDVQFLPMEKKAKAADSTMRTRPNVIRTLISNIGERIVAGTVHFELTHTTTTDEYKTKPQDFNSLPGDKFFVWDVLPDTLAKGKWAVVTIVDYGPDQPLKVAESEIEVE